MSKMNPDVKSRWVAALRSGEYRQGDQRALNDGDGGFCCLGVLCDLYVKDGLAEWEWTPNVEAMRLKDGGCYYPPDAVRGWASFHEDEQPVEIGDARVSVAVHNDGQSVSRRSFSEIADAIEAQL